MSDALQVAGRSFDELEQHALEQLLSKFHEHSRVHVTPPTFAKAIGIDDEKTGYRLFYRLKQIGAIDEHEDHGDAAFVFAGTTGPSYYWLVSPRIIDIVAARNAAAAARNQPTDRVAAMEQWVRTNRLFAWPLIAFLVIGAVATLLNQLAELIGRLFY